MIRPLAATLFAGFAMLAPVALSAQQPKAQQPPAQEAEAQPTKVNPDAQVLADFKARIDKYVELRKDADNTAKPLKETKEAGDIKESQLSLAERIGLARKGAKQGDILTPEVAALFKRLLRPESKETGTKEQIKDDNPGAGVPFKVNATYPDKEPLATMPPNVLETLPPLPEDVEYRFVGKHMILRDVRSNLIIDFMLNAIP